MLELAFWSFFVASLTVFAVYLYRNTKSQEEIDEELAQYVANQLRETERKKDQ